MKSMYASRSVPALNTPVSNAAYVDDSSSQNESLQRKADMANGAVQRVVQRETGVVQRVPPNFPIDQFVYRDSINNDLIYHDGIIAFTEYDVNLVSSNFTGCMMMAFKFNQSYTCKNFAGGGKEVNDQNFYIAHVFCNDKDDTKKMVYDAEKIGCIDIKSLYKPYDARDVDKIIEANTPSSKFTGSMKLNGANEWEADVYAPQVGNAYNLLKKYYPQHDDADKKLKHFNSEDLKFQTLATKAIIYASVLAQTALADEDEEDILDECVELTNPNESLLSLRRKVVKSLNSMKRKEPEAWNNLVRISFCNPKIIQTAIEMTSNDNDKRILSLFLK